MLVSAALLPQVRQLSERLGSEEVTELVARYLDGASTRRLAEELDVSRSALTRLLRAEGVQVRSRRNLLTETNIDEAARLYTEGLLLRQVAARFEVSTETVRLALVRRGTHLRTGLGARKR